MKFSLQLAKVQQHKRGKNATPAAASARATRWTRWHWAWLAVGLLLAGSSTLAVFEFFIWNKVPPELVGTWDVEEGPLSGGTFAFSRNGNLQMHFKKQGKDIALRGRVAVEDRTLFTTTQNALAGHEETTTSVIRELTARSLIIELDSGDVLKMGRWK
jgi:hypothetical protein